MVRIVPTGGNGEGDRTTNTRKVAWLTPWFTGMALAALFWWPLLIGAGFRGGDIYAYFFPLKQLYAEGLKANTIWLWHPLIGDGIPVAGESQTGVFYPYNLLAYRFLDLNSAYNAVFLCHYVLAFVFTYWLARGMGLSKGPSLLSALAFVYGWFPPRSCLEWAIITGAWMPLAVLASLRWMSTGQARHGIWLSFILCIQLLAGHFQIAFLTILAIGWIAIFSAPIGTLLNLLNKRWERLGRLAMLIGFVAIGFLLAGVQIAPTWELREMAKTTKFDQEAFIYGYIPERYFLQLVAPFYVYPNRWNILEGMNASTNVIEAHLYVGLAPMALAIISVPAFKNARQWAPWLSLAALGAILATGRLTPWLLQFPAFNFFRAPGRYGVLSALGLAMLAGIGAERLSPNKKTIRTMGMGIVLILTTLDLLIVAESVTYVGMTSPPAIDFVKDSPVRSLLSPTDRIVAPVPNELSLFGVSCVPPYLGLSPKAYSRWDYSLFVDIIMGTASAEPATLDFLRQGGVTHLLTRSPLNSDWPVEHLWEGYDPFLHPIFRSYGVTDPLHLYRLQGSPGRAYLRVDGKPDSKAGTTRITFYSPHRVEIACETNGIAQLVLADLAYPGWTATMDGEPCQTVADDFFRVIKLPPGTHRVVWMYEARSVWNGLAISAMTLAAILVAGIVYWFRAREKRSSGT